MKCKVLLWCCALLSCVTTVACVEEIQSELLVSTQLPCDIRLPDGADPDLLLVEWFHNSTLVASNEDNHTTPGYVFNTPSLNGSFPLMLPNVTFHQRGWYECQVFINGSLEGSRAVTLIVLVPPSLSVLSSVLVMGRESNLQCEATGFYPRDISFLWTQQGSEAMSSDAIITLYRSPDGLYRAVSSLPVTLTVPLNSNLSFRCEVKHEALRNTLIKEVKPSIIYLPSVSVSPIPAFKRSDPLTLSCDVSGFSPPNASVRWIQNGSALPDPAPVELNLDGTYRTRHFYTLTEEQRSLGGEVQCVVDQPLVSDGVSASVNLTVADPLVQEVILTKAAKASVAMMVISITLVLLLCFGFSWRRRDEKQKSLSVSGIILPPRVVVGQKGRITVSIEGRRADRVQTAWFLNDIPIADTTCTGPHHGRMSRVSVISSPPYMSRLSRVSVTSMSEKGPLLPLTAPGHYKLHTQQPLHSSSGGNKQLLSSVTFIPSLSLHKGAVFKCQVSYKGKDKVVEERVSDKFTVLAAPEVSEIRFSDSSESADTTMLTVQASRFHPDVITFRWFCEGGELSPVAVAPALAAPRPDAEGFFSAMSQCRLPRAELQKGGTRVWVTVHHIALKQPITRETRGFIRKPTVSEITTSTHNSTPILSCEITGFYPPDVAVTWLQLQRVPRSPTPGHEEEEEEEDDDEDEERVEVTEGTQLWGPLLMEPRMYRATAMLPSQGSEVKGLEPMEAVICRVDHCTFQAPVERIWRRANTVPPTIPKSLAVQWRKDGVAVFSVCLRGDNSNTELLWAAGGARMNTLLSKEMLRRDGQRHKRLTSTCALLRLPSQASQRGGTSLLNGQVEKPKDPILKCEAEVAFIDDEEEDEVRRSGGSLEDTKGEERVEKSKGEREDQMEEVDPALVNPVELVQDTSTVDLETLRVSLEITHPALNSPVYLTWTDSKDVAPQ